MLSSDASIQIVKSSKHAPSYIPPPHTYPPSHTCTQVELGRNDTVKVKVADATCLQYVKTYTPLFDCRSLSLSLSLSPYLFEVVEGTLWYAQVCSGMLWYVSRISHSLETDFLSNNRILILSSSLILIWHPLCRPPSASLSSSLSLFFHVSLFFPPFPPSLCVRMCCVCGCVVCVFVDAGQSACHCFLTTASSC